MVALFWLSILMLIMALLFAYATTKPPTMTGTCMQTFTCRKTGDCVPCADCEDDKPPEGTQWWLGDPPLPGMLPYGPSIIDQYPAYKDYYWVSASNGYGIKHVKSGDYVLPPGHGAG